MLFRAEYLFRTAVDGSALDDYWRLRPRFAFDFPLRNTEWTKGTSYGVVDIEPIFELRASSATVDEFRVRFGLGHLLTERWIAEAVWTMSLHAAEGGPLVWDRNMFRFRVKYRWQDLGRAVAAGLDF